MGVLIGLTAAVVIAAMVWARHRSKRLLSGTASARPVFQVDPPARRQGRLKDQRL